MHVKSKYIQAVEDAIDFIQHNVDGVAEDQNESETLKNLRELVKKNGRITSQKISELFCP